MATLNRINSILCLMLIGVTGCDRNSKTKDQDALVLSTKIDPTEVLVVEADRRPFVYLINTNGKIESSSEVQIQFRINGAVSEILVHNGLIVRKGDILAKIDERKYKLETQKAEVALRERKIAFEDQIMSFRSQSEEKLKVIHENIRYSSGLASAEVSYEQAKSDLENTIIRAPISGVVSDLSIREGNPVKSDELFCLVHDQSSLRVSCDVLEADAFSLSVGQRARVQPLFEKDKSFLGEVVSINPRVNSKTGLVKVQIALDESKKLLPGMNVGIEIRVPNEKNIIIPKEAIVIRSGRHVVFTVENGRARWNYVTVGRENGKEIEIIEGLKENQSVIVTNNLQLANDALVKELAAAGEKISESRNK